MILENTPEARAEAARIIREGGVIAFRTDTLYGLGADPINAAAVRRVRDLKGREESKPILLLISDTVDVDRFIINQTQTFKSVSAQFWPGPLTLIGEARSELPLELTAGSQTIGLRLPDDEELRSFVRECGGALTATSANPSALDPATDATQVLRYFQDGVDLILDAGEVMGTLPSTVLDLSGKAPRMIREGLITSEMLSKIYADPAAR